MAGFPKHGINKTASIAKQPRVGVALDKTISVQTMKALILKEHGNVSRVADQIGACRGSTRAMIDKYPELIDALKQSRERQLDMLEQSCFDRAIETNDTTLQLFLLKTQGKSRGYDQNEAQNAAKDIATAAFDFIISKQREGVSPAQT